jgi:hypothetical protein
MMPPKASRIPNVDITDGPAEPNSVRGGKKKVRIPPKTHPMYAKAYKTLNDRGSGIFNHQKLSHSLVVLSNGIMINPPLT